MVALVYTMPTKESAGVVSVGEVGTRGGLQAGETEAGEPGDQPDRPLTHWPVCAGWLEPGQRLQKAHYSPLLCP